MPDVNLSTILPERKGAANTFPVEYIEMQSMRRAFLRAWSAWLRTGPSERDVKDEAESTASAHRQIAELSWMPEPRPSRYQPRRGR
jgi:hypothetical protein